jgi:4-hydroxy-3-polyprenylbenzoate decarboxylase
MRSWIVGISGASGAVYGVRLTQWLLDAGYDVHGMITDAGWRVLKEEHAWDSAHRMEMVHKHFAGRRGTYAYYTRSDIGARVASGSFRTAGMVIMPCSMGTLGALAHSLSDELIQRAADVVRKERRPLILVPRETPLHAGHLQNMLILAQQGVHIVPAMPAFYHRPQTMDEMIDFMVGKVLDVMGIDHDVYTRWGG